jgi:hypothetical protein
MNAAMMNAPMKKPRQTAGLFQQYLVNKMND